MNILFMGTPDFAVHSLQALLDGGYPVIGVFTQSDKPKGRGHQLTAPPVKVLALEKGIPVYQPKTLRTPEAIAQIRDLNPDCIVVAAYGKILPLEVLSIPRYGCINVHGSLLPQYRGAAPIQWSVLNGEETTGITTMYMAARIDDGDMILKKEVAIQPNETASELFKRLAPVGGELLVETLRQLQAGTAPRIPQEEALATRAPMLSKEQAQIDFTKSAKEVHHLICGLSEWPCAVTTLQGKRLKVYHSALAQGSFAQAAGTVVDNKRFWVVCGDGQAVELQEVQYDNAKRMSASDFLRGRKVEMGEQLGSDAQ